MATPTIIGTTKAFVEVLCGLWKAVQNKEAFKCWRGLVMSKKRTWTRKGYRITFKLQRHPHDFARSPALIVVIFPAWLLG